MIGQFSLYQCKGVPGTAALHIFCNQVSKYVEDFFIIYILLFSHNVQTSIQAQVSPYNIGKKSIYMS